MTPLEKIWVGNHFKKSDMVPSKKKAIIVDIDGTLANSDHREHVLEHGNRDKYFDLVDGDTLNDWCADLIDKYKESGHAVILLTGRPERVRGVTENWLKDYDVQYDQLIMRGDQDREQGHIYKEKIYDNHLSDKFDVDMIIDNDPKIIEKFRRMGIPALEYEQEQSLDEGENDIADAIAEISEDLAQLVEYHKLGNTKKVIEYHEKLDTALHALVGKEGLRPEEKE